jgi:hypothetical protein
MDESGKGQNSFHGIMKPQDMLLEGRACIASVPGGQFSSFALHQYMLVAVSNAAYPLFISEGIISM